MSHYLSLFHHQRIALLGIMPPPYGGVSVHVARSIVQLKKQKNSILFWNTEPRFLRRIFSLYAFWLVWWLWKTKPDVLIYHSSYLESAPQELELLAALKKKWQFKLVIVEHNCRHLYTRSSSARAKLACAIRAADQQIFIGQSTYAMYSAFGMVAVEHRIDVAFIPPDMQEYVAAYQTYPADLLVWMGNASVIIMNASWLSKKNGVDVYGIDVAIEALTKMRAEKPHVKMVVLLSGVGDETYLQELRMSVQDSGVAPAIYFLRGVYQLWPLMTKADLFLRPTRADGDSVSVREALFMGCAVVASDVCERPAGVHCFTTGDADDCARVIMEVL